MNTVQILDPIGIIMAYEYSKVKADDTYKFIRSGEPNKSDANFYTNIECLYCTKILPNIKTVDQISIKDTTESDYVYRIIKFIVVANTCTRLFYTDKDTKLNYLTVAFKLSPDTEIISHKALLIIDKYLFENMANIVISQKESVKKFSFITKKDKKNVPINPYLCRIAIPYKKTPKTFEPLTADSVPKPKIMDANRTKIINGIKRPVYMEEELVVCKVINENIPLGSKVAITISIGSICESMFGFSYKPLLSEICVNTAVTSSQILDNQDITDEMGIEEEEMGEEELEMITKTRNIIDNEKQLSANLKSVNL